IVEAERKTQTVRLNFIRISLNLSVFFIYWLVFAQSLLGTIMTTRQTGGLNKGYKPTSPASA
ncbi:hypothetical protein K4X31_10020, partial [Streptococcus suis]|nr:hypothetical protein [Streptococcus suis]